MLLTPIKLITVAIVALAASTTDAASERSSMDPIRHFHQRLAEYMKLHRQVEAGVPALRVTEDAQEIENAVGAMAKGRGIEPAELLTTLFEERPYTERMLAVNERFLFFAMTPALILEVLPRLPSELQYRFVGADLALVDLHSSLIVDVLPHALSVN